MSILVRSACRSFCHTTRVDFPSVTTCAERSPDASRWPRPPHPRAAPLCVALRVVGALAARGESPASHRDERGAARTRRDDREDRLYLTEEQRRPRGWIARRMQTDFHHGLLENPWQISKDEWGLNSESDVARISSYIAKRLELSTEDGFSKIWRTQDKNPIGILGCYKVDEKMYKAFFFASEHMGEHGLKVTVEMRKILIEQASHHKGCKCVLYSASDHPRQIAWFRFLGFEYIPENNEGKARCFEYASPN